MFLGDSNLLNLRRFSNFLGVQSKLVMSKDFWLVFIYIFSKTYDKYLVVVISKYKQRSMYIYIKTKYKETGLSLLSLSFWLTIKQLKWIIKLHIVKYECKYKSQYYYLQCVSINIPHWHTIENDANRITIIMKTKEI